MVAGFRHHQAYGGQGRHPASNETASIGFSNRFNSLLPLRAPVQNRLRLNR